MELFTYTIKWLEYTYTFEWRQTKETDCISKEGERLFPIIPVSDEESYIGYYIKA